jgi:hypothetical protein
LSIQDDIFDIEDALKDKTEAKIFARLCEYLYAIEEDNSEKTAFVENIRKGIEAVKLLM